MGRHRRLIRVAAGALFALLLPTRLAAQGIENPTEAELLATAELIEFPSMFMDTLTIDDPHLASVAARMYRFRGSAGDSGAGVRSR